MFVESRPAIHDDNKDDRDNISIAQLNGADEHSIDVSYEVCKDTDDDNIEISPDDEGD